MTSTWTDQPHGRYSFLEGAPGTAPDGVSRELLAVRCQWCQTSVLGRARVSVLIDRHGLARGVVTAVLEMLAHEASCRRPPAPLPEAVAVCYGTREFSIEGRGPRRRARNRPPAKK